MSEKKHTGRRIRGREVLGRVLSCVAVASAGVAFAGTDGETMVPSFSFFTNSVPAGETETLSGKLRASPEAELIKTGGGDMDNTVFLLRAALGRGFYGAGRDSGFRFGGIRGRIRDRFRFS